MVQTQSACNERINLAPDTRKRIWGGHHIKWPEIGAIKSLSVPSAMRFNRDIRIDIRVLRKDPPAHGGEP
jgi:hypothetical protein